MDVVQIISTLGFPITACVAMAWYVKYQMDSYKDEVNAIREDHKNEVSKMTDALNNNTIALQRLVDKLGGVVDGNK